MRRGVSDVVAVLILIVIAIIGAVAVGYILTTSSHSVGNQVASQGNGNSAESTLYIGGSTTIFPVTEAAKATFESTYHINIVDAQGGSGGGMQGLIDGALDIGAASSLSAVYSAVTYVAANSLTGVSLDAFQVGGSGVVMITTSTGTGAAGTNAPNFLVDTTPTKCTAISQAAAIQMYTLGTFYLAPTACTGGGVNGGPANGELGYQAATAGAGTSYESICATAAGSCAGGAGPYQTFSRGDNSGTADTFAGWLGVTSTYPLLASTGEQGNPALLSAVQKCPNTDAGCIGYVDLGFGEGAVAGLSCGSGWVASDPCGVAIPEASTSQTTWDTVVQCSTLSAAANCFVPPLTSDNNLHSFILNALKAFSNADPYTNSGYTVSYPDASSPSTGLVKVFYYVTNGNPSPTEQEFINFMLSPNAQPYFNTNGYFAWVQYAAA